MAYASQVGFNASSSAWTYREEGGRAIWIAKVANGQTPIVIAQCSAEGSPSSLRPSELASLGEVSEARRTKFSIGRQCARVCLSHLVEGDVPLVKTSLGDVDWPQGIVGSVAHSTTTVLCAAAQTSDFLSVGIDTEESSERAVCAAAFVSVGDEFARFKRRTCGTAIDTATAFFVAKEATLKAVSSLLRQGIEYSDITIRVEEPSAGTRSIVDFTGWTSSHASVALCHGLVTRTGASITALAVIHGDRGPDDTDFAPPQSSP